MKRILEGLPSPGQISILTLYFISPLGLVAAIMSQNMDKYREAQFFIPMVMGVISYTWLLWQFVISARPKFIERHFGLDKMYRFHGLVALVAISGVIVHKLLNEQIFGETPMTQLGSAALALFIGITGLSLLFMANRLVKKIPILKNVVAWIETLRVVTYERLKLMHNLSWVAMVLMQIHVLMTGSAKASVLVFNVYMLYFFIGMGAYLYHKNLKPWLLASASKRYVVQDVVEQAGVFTLKLGAEKGELMGYKPGQFGYFTVQAEGLPVETHPFSISSAPSESRISGHLAVTIKSLGDFTSQMNKVKKGDTVMVEGPFGTFSYHNHRGESQSVFIAGGVGITPILSMLKEMMHTDPQRHVTLIWGVRTPQDLIQKTTLLALEQAMPNFKWMPVVSGDPSWNGLKGYITRETIGSILTAHSPLNGATGFFLCGPPILMETAKEDLEALGIAPKHIHYERFSA